jgi:hypothetical protein
MAHTTTEAAPEGAASQQDVNGTEVTGHDEKARVTERHFALAHEVCDELGVPPLDDTFREGLFRGCTPTREGEQGRNPREGHNPSGKRLGLRGDEGLARWDGDPRWESYVLGGTPLRVEPGEQVWMVGGHRLVVSVWRDARDECKVTILGGWPNTPAFVIGDPRGRKNIALTLAEVFAISSTGTVRRLRKPALVRWKRRGLAEAKLITVPPVPLSPLPEPATCEARRVYAGMADLLAIRALTEERPEPFPFSVAFGSDWTGLDARVIERGRYHLERDRVIFRMGECPSAGGRRPMVLWGIAGYHDLTKEEEAA